MDWNAFTPYSALLGGALIGLAAALFLLGTGGIAGISGLLARAWQSLWTHEAAPARQERWLFLAGLVAAPLLWRLLAPLPSGRVDAGVPLLVVAGLLVGVGTRMGNGCTSGHGVCGIARGARRSMVATAVFVGTGVVTVFVLRHLA
jgi:uncharacterized protein